MLTPIYINNKNTRKYLRFIEWKAILRLVYDTDNTLMLERFPDYAEELSNWNKKYTAYIGRNSNSPKARALNTIYLDLLNNKIADLNDFYQRLRVEFVYFKPDKVLEVKINHSTKASGTLKAYADKRAVLVGDNMLVGLILKNAVALANTNYTPAFLWEVVNSLALEYYHRPPKYEELSVLQGILTKKVNLMEKSITMPEAIILRHPIKKLAKNSYHLYGLFKLQCEVGDTWELPLAELAKAQLGVGKPVALEALDLLLKMKLIEISEPKQQEAVGLKTVVYKRLK